MKVLVTGGGGFIGSNLVEALLRRGDDVRVIDNFATGRRENLAEAPAWAEAGGGRFELVEGDIRDEEAVRRAVADRDVVLHQAAIPSVARSVADPLTSPAPVRSQVPLGVSIASVYLLLMLNHVVFTLFFAVSVVCAVRGALIFAQNLRASSAREPIPATTVMT